jgi:cytoskeletal protein RodZ
MRAKTKGISIRRGAITMAAGLLLMVALAACTTTPTQTPTPPPTQPPTATATQAPTEAATQPATAAPTQAPTEAPTQPPTVAPTQPPTEVPTQAPTEMPTEAASPTTAVATATSAGAASMDGANLVDTRCSVCHTTDRIKNAHKTLDQWEQTVTRMIGHGAKLTDAEKAFLVDYLAKTYGP